MATSPNTQNSNQEQRLRAIQVITKTFGWLHIFLVLQFSLQILLLFPQFGVLRPLMRIAAFGMSLFLLVWLPGPGQKLPGKATAIGIMMILLMQFFFNPSLNSVPAGLAQCALYLAIIAPLFWVSRLSISVSALKWLIYILWGFHTLSSIFGLLQIYFPGQYQPFLSTAIQNQGWGGENLKIVLANGSSVFRPMGLTDVPGGAARSGFYALLFGTGIALQERHHIFKTIGALSVAIGLFSIYMSQIRSTLVNSIICLIILFFILYRQGKILQASTMAGGMIAMFIAVFSWAVAVGGQQTLNRIMSLTSDDPSQVFQQNRGHFLTTTIQDLLPQYPLGAGLGRWGPLNGYFGDSSNPLTQALWVEIQWTGWLFDGGLPLIIAYVLAIGFTVHGVWKISMMPGQGELRFWAALIIAYDAGAFAVLFNYPLFIGQGGMEFWVLNAAILVAIGSKSITKKTSI
ncbi:MAG: hypothetical protein MH252_12510 [Thermosynechococcaceae cyanobacterium MS004]|nr:hypothetical protein [Thermosynechococcaceae cyanobacterium MS004]